MSISVEESASAVLTVAMLVTDGAVACRPPAPVWLSSPWRSVQSRDSVAPGDPEKASVKGSVGGGLDESDVECAVGLITGDDACMLAAVNDDVGLDNRVGERNAVDGGDVIGQIVGDGLVGSVDGEVAKPVIPVARELVVVDGSV